MKKLLFVPLLLLACLTGCQKTEVQSEDPELSAQNATRSAGLTTATNGLGTVSVSTDNPAVGVPFTVTANPNSGSVFDHWLVNGRIASTDRTLTLTRDANSPMDVVAIFIPQNPAAAGVNIITVHNDISATQFNNECEMQYVGPDGVGYVERFGPGCAGKTLKFPSQPTPIRSPQFAAFYIELESLTESIYFAYTSFGETLYYAPMGNRLSSMRYLDGGEDITIRAETYNFRDEISGPVEDFFQ